MSGEGGGGGVCAKRENFFVQGIPLRNDRTHADTCGGEGPRKNSGHVVYGRPLSVLVLILQLVEWNLHFCYNIPSLNRMCEFWEEVSLKKKNFKNPNNWTKSLEKQNPLEKKNQGATLLFISQTQSQGSSGKKRESISKQTP